MVVPRIAFCFRPPPRDTHDEVMENYQIFISAALQLSALGMSFLFHFHVRRTFTHLTKFCYITITFLRFPPKSDTFGNDHCSWVPSSSSAIATFRSLETLQSHTTTFLKPPSISELPTTSILEKLFTNPLFLQAHDVVHSTNITNHCSLQRRSSLLIS
ncbi:hypothetical protein DL96DRAFT_1270442 [Flagelloscypha sp. PMI_526]|nr:hypothetical protein DL96DRAFT_1270442 [Flagelloscypha sp. PMI_526]